MTAASTSVDLRKERTIGQIMAVSGLDLGSVRTGLSLLFEPRPLNEDSKLSPGEIAVLLVFNALSRMGYTRDRISLLLRPFIPNIVEYVQQDKTKQLGLLMIHDNQFGVWELDRTRVVNINDGAVLTDAVLPLPTLVVSVSVLGLYLRTLSKLQDLPDAKEVEKPESASVVALPGSPAQPELPPLSQ